MAQGETSGFDSPVGRRDQDGRKSRGRVIYDTVTSRHAIAVSDSMLLFFFSSRRRHTRLQGDWSSDVCSSDLADFSRQARERAASNVVALSAKPTRPSSRTKKPEKATTTFSSSRRHRKAPGSRA